MVNRNNSDRNQVPIPWVALYKRRAAVKHELMAAWLVLRESVYAREIDKDFEWIDLMSELPYQFSFATSFIKRYDALANVIEDYLVAIGKAFNKIKRTEPEFLIYQKKITDSLFPKLPLKCAIELLLHTPSILKSALCLALLQHIQKRIARMTGQDSVFLVLLEQIDPWKINAKNKMANLNQLLALLPSRVLTSADGLPFLTAHIQKHYQPHVVLNREDEPSYYKMVIESFLENPDIQSGLNIRYQNKFLIDFALENNHLDLAVFLFKKMDFSVIHSDWPVDADEPFCHWLVRHYLFMGNSAPIEPSHFLMSLPASVYQQLNQRQETILELCKKRMTQVMPLDKSFRYRLAILTELLLKSFDAFVVLEFAFASVLMNVNNYSLNLEIILLKILALDNESDKAIKLSHVLMQQNFNLHDYLEKHPRIENLIATINRQQQHTVSSSSTKRKDVDALEKAPSSPSFFVSPPTQRQRCVSPGLLDEFPEYALDPPNFFGDLTAELSDADMREWMFPESP